MMKTAGMAAHGAVGPAGSAGKVKLSGDSHTIKILSVEQEKGTNEKGDVVESAFKNAVVEYPDGHVRHHQVSDLPHLLGQVSTQLKGRYNLKSFTFAQAPSELAAGDIITGDNVHDA